MTYEVLLSHWKILFDYCCWVRDGGEPLYGDVTVANRWCERLMAAMATVVVVM